MRSAQELFGSGGGLEQQKLKTLKEHESYGKVSSRTGTNQYGCCMPWRTSCAWSACGGIQRRNRFCVSSLDLCPCTSPGASLAGALRRLSCSAAAILSGIPKRAGSGGAVPAAARGQHPLQGAAQGPAEDGARKRPSPGASPLLITLLRFSTGASYGATCRHEVHQRVGIATARMHFQAFP